MEDIGIEIDKEIVAEDDFEANSVPDSTIMVVRTIPGIRASQRRKRTRASHKAASSSNTGTKKTKVASFASTVLQAKLPCNKHFYTKEAEFRIKELVGKLIMGEKKVSRQTLA